MSAPATVNYQPGGLQPIRGYIDPSDTSFAQEIVLCGPGVSFNPATVDVAGNLSVRATETEVLLKQLLDVTRGLYVMLAAATNSDIDESLLG